MEPASPVPAPTPISTLDVLTPVHKGLRAMIYALGNRLQTTDFTDERATETVVADLTYQFAAGVPGGCVLCLLHAHAGHEDEWGFPPARPFAPELIDELLADHHRFTRDLAQVAAMTAQLAALHEPAPRIAAGLRLNQFLNDFFQRYLAHMNREETALVPLLNLHLTDAEIAGMRTAVERSMAPDRFAALNRWILGALDANELTAILSGRLAATAPAEREPLLAFVRSAVDPVRWQVVAGRLGLPEARGPP